MSSARDNIAVIVVYADDDTEERQRNLAHVLGRWQEDGWEPVIGEGDASAWCKGRAVAGGLAKIGTDITTLVITDADVIIDARLLAGSLEDVVSGNATWAMPHNMVVRLSEDGTANAIRTGHLHQEVELIGGKKPAVYQALPGGGLVVIQRDLYEQAPFDPRFVGWGHEDRSAGVAWRTLGGAPWIGRGKLTHLWHQPQPRLQLGTGSRESKELSIRYDRAAGNPAQMLRLIAEATTTV